jgi:membrane-bound lytic murein transglycosylase MltF
MALTKFDLFKNQWMCFWANFTRFIFSKQFAFCLVLALTIGGFIMGFVFKYESIRTELTFQHFMRISQEEARQQDVKNKVEHIMDWYKCDSKTIFDAIMNTFDPVLIATLIACESEFNPNAISPSGALGLCQIMPDKLRKNDDWRNPETNIKIGSSYLKEMLRIFNGDFRLALAGYNAGPGRVIKSGYQIPVTKNNETKNYVQKADKITKLVANLR